MNKYKKVTSKDVAKSAGVSQSAVSMILNNKNHVSFSEETIKKVLAAAKELNYTIKTSKPISTSNTIAVICPTVSNPYYSTLVQSIEQCALKANYKVLTCNTYRNNQLEEEYIKHFIDMNVAGIIFTFLPSCVDLLHEVCYKKPIVIIGDKNESIDIDTIELNSIKSGMLIGDHLIALGHKKIAFISTTLDPFNVPRSRRLEGLKIQLAKAGLENNLIVKTENISAETELNDTSIEHKIGYRLTKEILSKHDITAFVGVNDMVAYGIIDALIDAGLNIPMDYSVCGCDNIFPSTFRSIDLTTVEHFIQHKGNNAFEILHKKIQHQSERSVQMVPSSVMRVEYHPNLIIRNSTAPPRVK